MACSPKGVLRVWDGTGPPTTDPLPIGTNIFPENEPSSRAVSSIAKVIEQMNEKLVLPNNDFASEITHIDPPKSLCGRVLNLVIWETSHWEQIRSAREHFEVGKFLRLRNVSEVCAHFSIININLAILHYANHHFCIMSL
jgi:hypothetical protein